MKKNKWSTYFLFLLFLCCHSLCFSSTDWVKDQIQEEFLPFQKGFDFSMIEQTFQRRAEFSMEPSLIIIKNNKVYSNTEIANSLKKLAKVYRLPDLIFFYCNGPGPIQPMKLCDGFAPLVLAGNKTKNMKNVILIFDRYSLSRDGRYGLQDSLDEIQKYDIAWEEKISKVFWRGDFTDSPIEKGLLKTEEIENFFHEDYFSPRLSLVLSSIKNPDLVNALFFIPDNPYSTRKKIRLAKLNIFTMAPFSPIKEHLLYKYLISLDGITCTNPGLAWRFFSNSCVFLVQSPNYQWFYRGLQPWTHYVPVENDMSDLIEKIQWARSHDKQVYQIVAQAKIFTEKYLTPSFFLDYTYQVLLKYASLQRFSKNDYLKAFQLLENKEANKH